jgi:hypothetical protein
LYHRGYQSYQERNFAEATTFFQEAYELQRNSTTAYMISLCFYYARDLSNAKRYARLALRDPPGLEERFRDGAHKITELTGFVISGNADSWSPPEPDAPTTPVRLASEQQPTVLVHLEGLGDTRCRDGDWCGTKGEYRRLEGFWVTLPQSLGNNIQLKYMCHLERTGDTPWMLEGAFCGSRHQSLRLEGFAIKLVGSDAPKFNVLYQAHLQDIGDTKTFANGQFAGTRGQSRQIEAIRIWLERR